MFIRETVKTLKKNGKVYKYVQHGLVQSVRINNQPRQQTLLTLGTLSTLADLTEFDRVISRNLTSGSQLI